jgi:hypothetical protein
MPERFDLGGAAFHLAVTSDQFKRALAQAEADARAASAKIDAALRGGAITPKVNNTPANAAFGQIVTQAKAAQTASSFTATPKVNAQPAQTALRGLGGGFGGAAAGALALGAGLVGVTAGIGLAAAAIQGSVEATREAQQATFALNTTYGAGASTFAKFADEQAKALGRTSAEFKQAAVVASTLTNNYGLTAQQLQTLIKRSADLAAVQGLSVVDATNRVTSAIRGEAEAAELLGLTLNSDAIKAIAEMTDQQRKNFETLDTLTKAQITYREFLRQTAAAEGAAAKAAADGLTTYDQAGAAFNRLGVEAGNSIDPIGKGLAGAFRSAADAVAEFLRQQRQLPGYAQRATALTPVVRGGANDDPEARRVAQFEALRSERAKEASAKAQLDRAEAGRLAAIARESQSEITKSALDRLNKVAAAEAEKARESRERITDVRDADIAASNARKDAALASLDREAAVRSRSRTQEDRARSAGQEAELRGLEAVHEANVKGAAEAIETIEKRRDVAVKGLDEEIRAVDRKRDAAIKNIDEEVRAIDRRRDSAVRAIDEELRAESRRHDEAVRNIDIERDRRLGIIDDQLKKLDAAAQRDQRRQTDQSLNRSLGDARRDLKEADTPEERARARRAVSDAEAAIQRERVNRQREDARARLRDAADQIRLAADTAKKVEDARNQATTDTLGERKRGVTETAETATARLAERKRELDEQAKADTERLTAIKVRVDEQTKIELDSIKVRIDKEKEAYAQTVQDARDSHQAINDAVADRRTDEDAELAARRIATQAHYAAEQTDIKAVADTQLEALEKSTSDTAKELDLQKAVWSDWARHVEKEIAAAITAGDPNRIRNLTATPPEFQNEGAGPGEPPSRGNIPASFLNSGRAVGAGFAAGIASEESVAAVTGATNTLIQGGVIDEATRLLQIESPSKVFAGFGTDTAQGFLDGYATVDLAVPIRKPFEDSIDWLRGLPDHFRQSGTDSATAWQDAYQQYDLFAAGRLPFENLETWINPGFANQMMANGTAAGTAWQAGYAANDIFVVGRKPFEDLLRWMAGVPPRFQTIGQNSATAFGNGLLTSVNTQQRAWWDAFETVGKNLAVSLNNGFQGQLQSNPLQTPATSGGGTSFQTAATGSTAGATSSFQRFGHNDAQAYLVGKGYSPGTSAFNELFDRLFELQNQGYTPPPDMHVTGRAMGGTLKPYEWSWVGEGGKPELIRAGRDGATVKSYSDSMAMLRGAGGARGLSLNLTVNASGASIGNPDAFAARIQHETVRAVVNLLDAAERGAPDPAPETQAGA